jgi:response regulator of citrate/malate metabolism
MSGQFSIHVDVDRHLVRVTMAGFFSPADVARFVEVRDAEHRKLRCGINEHFTLVDIRAMQIQSQEAVAEFQRVLSAPATASKRIAFVVAKSLARLQIQRAAEGRPANYFASVEDAEHWLLTGEG